MEVKCPHCDSRFNLPDSVVKPGAKLRCSVCQSVFTLPSPSAAAAPSAPRRPEPTMASAPFSLDEEEQPRKRNLLPLLLILLVLLVLVVGVVLDILLQVLIITFTHSF